MSSSLSWHSNFLPDIDPVSPIELSDHDHTMSPRNPSTAGVRPPWMTEAPLHIQYNDDNSRGPPSTATLHNNDEIPQMLLQSRPTFSRHAGSRKSPLQPKSRRFLTTVLTGIAAVFTSVFSVYYSYTVLVSASAVPPALALSPGQTVLVINVLSHVVAFFCWNLVSDSAEALRWALACGEDGILLTSFLALSRATPLCGVAYLCLVPGKHVLWALQRIASIVIVTLLGLVLITDVTFKNIYTASTLNEAVDVLAGLAPLNTDYLPFVEEALISLYAGTYSAGFLTDTRFVTNVAPVNCTGEACASVFLPGGLHTVRLANRNPNSTLFGGELNGDYTSILVNNAPGYQVDFSGIEDYRFREEDCKIYSTDIGLRDYGLYVCLASQGPMLLAGWTVCPSSISSCGTDLSWTHKYPMDQSTTIAWYKRYATVAYDRRNMSILTIENLSAPLSTPIPADKIRLYFDIVMKDPPHPMNLTSKNAAAVCASYTVQYGLGWLLRMYQNDFRDYEDGALRIIRGFLAIPLQFSTEIWQQASLSTLPQDLKVTAQLSRVSYRAIIQPWTVYAFAGMAAVVVAWGGGCLVWCMRGPWVPNSSYFPEVDITSKGTSPTAGIGESEVASLRSGEEKSGPYAMARPVGDFSTGRDLRGGFDPLPALDQRQQQQYHRQYEEQFPGSKLNMEVEERGGESDAEETFADLEYLTRKYGLGNGMSYRALMGVRKKKIYCGAYVGGDAGADGGEVNHIVIVTERGRVRALGGEEGYC